jgi:DNA-binding transcriptional MerR regulator
MAKKKVEEAPKTAPKVVKPDIKAIMDDRLKQMRDAQSTSRKAQLKRQVEMLDARIEQMTKVREDTQAQLDKMG